MANIQYHQNYYYILKSTEDSNYIDNIINDIVIKTFLYAISNNDLITAKKVLDKHKIEIIVDIYRKCIELTNNYQILEWLLNIDVNFDKLKIFLVVSSFPNNMLFSELLLNKVTKKDDIIQLMYKCFLLYGFKFIEKHFEYINAIQNDFMDYVYEQLLKGGKIPIDLDNLIIHMCSKKLRIDILSNMIRFMNGNNIKYILHKFNNDKNIVIDNLKKQLPHTIHTLIEFMHINNMDEEQWIDILQYIIDEQKQEYEHSLSILIRYHLFSDDILSFMINYVMDNDLYHIIGLLISHLSYNISNQYLNESKRKTCKIIVSHFKNKPSECLQLSKEQRNYILSYIRCALQNDDEEIIRKKLLKNK